MPSRKKIIAFAAAILIPAILSAQNRLISIENTGLYLDTFTLRNGLTVFVIPDKNSALVTAELVCKAGFSSQTPSTCGFFSMYARLFSESAQKEASNLFDLVNLQCECKSQSSNFSAILPPEETQHYFNALSACLSKPDFDDKKIKTLFSQMKKESADYASSTTGFINSSIDSRVFTEEPWKHDSGIYPALFSDFSVSQARTILSNIGINFYTPENCALFVSGNIEPDQVHEAAEKAFSTWKRTGKKTAFNNIPETNSTPNEGKKFVLVSDDFSKDMTQIIVQFTSLSMTDCDLLAAAMNRDDSLYRNNLPAENALCIRGSEYLAAASAQVNGHSRLILQSLMEDPQSANIISGQAETFVRMAKETAKLSRSDFIKAQNEILFKFRLKTGNSRAMAELLASYWPDAAWTTPEEFYEGFLDSIYKVQFKNENAIAELVEAEEPFIFLLVNTDKYKAQKKNFDEAGYIKIDGKNSSWWKDEMLSKKAKAEKKLILKEDVDGKTKVVKAKPAEHFYANALKTIKEKNLKNGIPVSVKTNRGSQTICVSVAIKGGMTASPVKEKNLRTILVAALAKNSGLYGTRAETKETISYVSYEVIKENFEESLQMLTNALIYGDIKPVQADRLFADENYRIMMENADLGSQMKRNVFAYLYRDTKPGQMYRDYDNKNNSASYQSLLTGYTEFLDASLYSIVVCGDIEADKVFDTAEKTFGILKNQNDKKENTTDFPKPAWKNKERRVQLRHLYSSDLPPELAPKESPLLIPTKEFLDPVQIYFAAPENPMDIEKFNALLMEISSRIDRDIESYCKSYRATPLIPIGYIHGNKIKKTEEFMKLYRKHRQELLEELADKKKRTKALRTIKSRYEIDLLERTATNEGTAELMQQSILNGNTGNYLACYLAIENTSAKDFYDILIACIPEEPLMKVHSVDGK
ncbi:insulinase family protein [Treponema sp.]|uniref:insulinase family protein n=1 Tax=Treponema sp. TaxID=166 RepID=UPI00298E4EAF|nr:insulinase family protein [Treponema sp.]MCQ2241056.1 insulinase family protein [Treponema sp.]